MFEPVCVVENLGVEAGVLRLRVEGEFDLSAHAILRGAMAHSPWNACSTVLLEIGGLRFADSEFLDALLKVRRGLPQGGGVTLSNVRPNVRRMFDLTRTSGLFEFHGE